MNAAQTEKIIREAIKTRAETVENIGIVLTRRAYIASLNQYLALLGTKSESSKRNEIKLLLVEFVGFADTDRGCDDCPVPALIYNLHLSHEFVEKRPDGTNSSDDFAAVLLNLRQAFVANRNLGLPDTAYHDALLQTDLTQIGLDEMTGIEDAHFADFRLDVQIIANC